MEGSVSALETRVHGVSGAHGSTQYSCAPTKNQEPKEKEVSGEMR
jgi:hypothetical protein